MNMAIFLINFPQQQKINIYVVMCFVIGLFHMANAEAAAFTVASGAFAPCSSGNLTESGTTFTCNGNIFLGASDDLIASTSVTLVATGNISLDRRNIIGTSTNRISLRTTSGTITASNTGVGNTSTIFGDISTTSGAVSLTHVTMNGTINAAAAITFNNVTMATGSISGTTVNLTNSSIGTSTSSVSITATNGAISLTTSTVFGNLTAPANSTVYVPADSSVTGICIPNSTLANACIAPPVCTTGFIGGLNGNYFNNQTLAGTATTLKTDNIINFDWGTGASGVVGIPANNFSIRWTGALRAPATGAYQFQTVSDDGVRLWINNVLVIDNWNDHLATTNTTASINLVAGQSYPVRLEYYDNAGSAVIGLNWSQPGFSTFTAISTETGISHNTSSFCAVPVQPCTSGFVGGVSGQYFNNVNLTGTPTGTRPDLTVDFNWGNGTPGVAGIGADNFSVRWDGTLKTGTTGTYQFETVSDDGVRVWVNNILIINNWTVHGPTTDVSATMTLTAGVTYPVRVEYFEGGGGSIMGFRWKRPSDSTFVPINGCPSVVSYYTISHSGTGITCAAEPITIAAYDTAGSLVPPTAGTQITLSTVPATGTWATSNTYTFSGAETSAIKHLRQITPATLNINVSDGTKSESASFDPNITFVNSALKFYADSSGSVASATMPNQVAAVASPSPILKAIRTDTVTGACVAQTTGSKSVSLAYECRNPTTCVAGQVLSLNGTGIQSNANGAALTYSTQTLNFNAAGVASIPFNYTDVGQVKLHAQLALGAVGDDPAITLSGSSNDFVVKPYTLVVSSVLTGTGGPNPGGTNTAGAAAGFVAAGIPFQVNVEARNFAGNLTPNFGREEIPENNNMKLAEVALIYPAGGTLTALTGAAANSFTPTPPTGTFVNSTVVWNQVGSITLRPELTDNDYLGAGNIPVFSTSGTIGRFYPNHYTLLSSATTNGCGTFSYMGQPNISLSYQLLAQSLGGTTLTNYGGNYASVGSIAAPTYVAENADGANGGILSARVSAGGAGTWTSGVYLLNSATQFNSTVASFNRQLINSVPDGPYSALQLGMGVTDGFDLRNLQGKNMNETTTGACTGAGCTAVSLGLPLALRYGRLRLDDAFGPETVELPVNFFTEYWTGNYFALNTSDSCTVIPRAAVSYPSGNLTVDANRTISLSSGNTQGTYTNIDATSIYFNAGSAGHKFSAPSTAGTGAFIVGIDLTNLLWLRYDWNQDGNYADTAIPNARYSFGSYRGNDRIIYWRERLQ